MPLTPLSRPFSRTQTAGRTKTGGFFRDSKGLVREIPTAINPSDMGDIDGLAAMQIERGTNGLSNAASIEDQADSRVLARQRIAQARAAMASRLPEGDAQLPITTRLRKSRVKSNRQRY